MFGAQYVATVLIAPHLACTNTRAVLPMQSSCVSISPGLDFEVV
jgi:hypothetical protein